VDARSPRGLEARSGLRRDMEAYQRHCGDAVRLRGEPCAQAEPPRLWDSPRLAICRFQVTLRSERGAGSPETPQAGDPDP
jgi:hypothetical protein